MEKHIEDFYNKITECKECNCKQGLERNYKNKDRISTQQNFYCEKNRDKLLQKQNERQIQFKELLRSYAVLENRIKFLEEISQETNQYLSN